MNYGRPIVWPGAWLALSPAAATAALLLTTPVAAQVHSDEGRTLAFTARTLEAV